MPAFTVVYLLEAVTQLKIDVLFKMGNDYVYMIRRSGVVEVSRVDNTVRDTVDSMLESGAAIHIEGALGLIANNLDQLRDFLLTDSSSVTLKNTSMEVA